MKSMSQLVVLLLVLFQATATGQKSGYTITEFGAVGDGERLNTVAIQSAIDTCAARGGGSVIVPPGIFMTGTLQLRDKVNLHLESGSVLKGTNNLNDYRRGGRIVGLIFTQDAEHVSITGEGTIDGNGDAFMNLDSAKEIENAGVMLTRQKERFREVQHGIGDGPVVPKERPYQMIIFSDCRNVTVRDVLITNSPFWTLHCADCDGVIVSGVRIWCNLLAPNSDGVDFTSCSNVLMSDCDIRTGDDCIAITGYSHHFDLPGYKDLKHDSENITITNCTLMSRSAAIRIGGFDQNSMRNYTFTNLTITNSNRGIGIFVRDVGSIENLVFSNVIIDTRLHTGDWWGNGEPIHLSAIRLTKDVALGRIRNVKFQNMICRGESGMLVFGTDESLIENISMEDVSFHIADSKLNDVSGGNFDLRPALDSRYQLFAHDIPGIYAQYVRNLRIEDVDLTWDAVRQPFFTHGLEIAHFSDVRIENFNGTAAPGKSGIHAIVLRDGKGYSIERTAASVLKENVKN